MRQLLAIAVGLVATATVPAAAETTAPALYKIRVSTGESRLQHSIPQGVRLLGLSPDRQQLLIVRHGGQLDVAGIDGSAERTIADPGFGYQIGGASWSPRGNWIAFDVSDGPYCGAGDPPCTSAIWLVRPDGRELHRLSDEARYPTWSYDGRRLAFVGRYSLYPDQFGKVTVIRPDGSGRRELTGHVHVEELAWAPSGDRLAYVVGSTGACCTSIVVRTPAGRRVGGFRNASAPAWAPKEHALAYVQNGAKVFGGLVVYANGRKRRLGTHVVQRPIWSPNGRWISWIDVGNGDNNGAVIIAHSNGTGLRRLTARVDSQTFLELIGWSHSGSDIFAAYYPVG